MATKKDIETVLYPEHGVLKADKEGTLKATIVDIELDGIECIFNNDDCVELNTDMYTYLTLSKQNLHDLMVLIEKAEETYNKQDDY